MRRPPAICSLVLWLVLLLISNIGLISGKKSDVEIDANCHAHEDGGCSHCHDPCDIGDIFFQWNCLALEANVLDHNGLEPSGDQLSLTQGPPASARALAMIHTAMFDAYNVVAGGGRYETFLANVRERISGQGASVEAAVATAAYKVMTKLYNSNQLILEMVDNAYERMLNEVRSARYRERGVAVGMQVAEYCFADRKDDGYAEEDPYLMNDPYVYQPTGEPGDHDEDPENKGQGFFNPGAGHMTPFGIDDIEVFRAPMPPGLEESVEGIVFNRNNSYYMAALMEVMEKGIFRGGLAGEPFPEDDAGYDIANYWSYNGSPCTGTPPRLYNMIARDIAKQMQNNLDDNALLFTMLNVALGNAGIASWDSKYYYRLWRPINGIRSLGADMGQEFENWSPLGASRSNPYESENNFSPPFPAYTSGHATFGAAALKTLLNFYQTANIPITFVSDEWNGRTRDQFGRIRPVKPRTFTSLRMAIAENAASRVFNGVHWRFDGTAGVEVGCRIADYIFTKLFLRLNHHIFSFEEGYPSKKSKRVAVPDGDLIGAIDCILRNPDYQQQSGTCSHFQVEF